MTPPSFLLLFLTAACSRNHYEATSLQRTLYGYTASSLQRWRRNQNTTDQNNTVLQHSFTVDIVFVQLPTAQQTERSKFTPQVQCSCGGQGLQKRLQKKLLINFVALTHYLSLPQAMTPQYMQGGRLHVRCSRNMYAHALTQRLGSAGVVRRLLTDVRQRRLTGQTLPVTLVGWVVHSTLTVVLQRPGRQSWWEHNEEGERPVVTLVFCGHSLFTVPNINNWLSVNY